VIQLSLSAVISLVPKYALGRLDATDQALRDRTVVRFMCGERVRNDVHDRRSCGLMVGQTLFADTYFTSPRTMS
jgi:hypothetical protein